MLHMAYCELASPQLLEVASSAVLGWCSLRYWSCRGTGDSNRMRGAVMSFVISILDGSLGNLFYLCRSSGVFELNARQHRLWYCAPNS